MSGGERGHGNEGRLATVSAAVLLGGSSSRMGRDKARIELEGVALATRTARLLEPLFEDVLLVGGDPPAEAPGRRVPDVEGPRCALRGLVSALAAARAERVLVVSTDLPLLTADLVLGLVCHPGADAVVPRSAEGSHPLCAVYAREAALPAARKRLAEGRLALRELLDELDTAWLEGAALRALDPEGGSLLNVNTEADLEAARGRWGAR